MSAFFFLKTEVKKTSSSVFLSARRVVYDERNNGKCDPSQTQTLCMCLFFLFFLLISEQLTFKMDKNFFLAMVHYG